MKTSLIALTLLALTAGAVLSYPKPASGPSSSDPVAQPQAPDNRRARVEVVFVLDTTGSMSGLIETAKEKIWSIATTMASAQPAPEIHLGLVAYRDRGDAYVTRLTDLSTDLDSMYATLMDYRADGGGDGPESVNAALAAAVDGISWSQEPDTYRVVFLVGDAPPHMDYQDEEQFPSILARARARGIVVNTIRCGHNHETERAWRQIAGLTQGDFFTVDQAGGAIAIATPFDADLAAVSRQLDGTRLYFGDEQHQAQAAAKAAATDKLHAEATVSSRARRAAFNASGSGEPNQFGELDLLSALASGRTTLEEIPAPALPPEMRAMTPEAREAYASRRMEERTVLKARLEELSDQREAYLATQAEGLGDLTESLDYQIFESVRSQAEKEGLRYQAPGPKL